MNNETCSSIALRHALITGFHGLRNGVFHVLLSLASPQLIRLRIRHIGIRKGAGEVSRTHPLVQHCFLSLRVTTGLPAGPRGHQLDHAKSFTLPGKHSHILYPFLSAGKHSLVNVCYAYGRNRALQTGVASVAMHLANRKLNPHRES